MKKTNIYFIVAIVLLIILLIPIPVRLKDGGSIEYNAVLYSITKYHSINPESSKGYDDGWKIKILGLTIYDEKNTYVDVKENNVALSIKDNTLSKDMVTIVLKNNTNNDYTYGPDFYIEKYENGKWYEPSTITGEPLTWNSIAYILKANESAEETINFKSTYGELSNGKYRIIKRVFKNEDVPISDDKIEKISVEFEIK